MSKTLKMIVNELPKTMGQLNHELLLEDLKIALKEVVALEQQLQQAHRAAEESAKDAHRRGWEQAKAEALFIVQNYEHNPDRDGDFADQLDEEIAVMEYMEG